MLIWKTELRKSSAHFSTLPAFLLIYSQIALLSWVNNSYLQLGLTNAARSVSVVSGGKNLWYTKKNLKSENKIIRWQQPTRVDKMKANILNWEITFLHIECLTMCAYTCICVFKMLLFYIETKTTGWPKKSKPQSFVNILANYWPIFKIFSLLHSVTNL